MLSLIIFKQIIDETLRGTTILGVRVDLGVIAMLVLQIQRVDIQQ